MADSKSTKHLVMDLKTGFAYGVKLSEKGECESVQPLNLAVEALDGRIVRKFGPLISSQPVLPVDSASTGNAAPSLPYGQITHMMELKPDGKDGKIFTMAWPDKAAAEKGALPTVTSAPVPKNLVQTGFAPAPQFQKGQKGSAVDNDEELKGALKNIDTMIGLTRAKHDIKQNIAVARFNRMKEELGIVTNPISRHMVFTGNPGTGKTTFAREVAKVYHALGFIEKAEVHEVKREDLVAGFVGQTAIKTKEAIEKAKGGILFIDEAYALSRQGGGSDNKDFGREAIDTLVAAMENMREELIVIVAGYPEPMKKFIDANEGLKSRFMTYIGFDDYDVDQLGEIFDFMLKERGYTIEPKAREHVITLLKDEKSRAKKEFGNGRTVRNLVEKSEKELALRLQGENKLVKDHGLSKVDIKKALTHITFKDVEAVTLAGLGAAKGSSMGFSKAAKKDVPKKAANDINPPAAKPMEGKQKSKFLKKSFKR